MRGAKAVLQMGVKSIRLSVRASGICIRVCGFCCGLLGAPADEGANDEGTLPVVGYHRADRYERRLCAACFKQRLCAWEYCARGPGAQTALHEAERQGRGRMQRTSCACNREACRLPAGLYTYMFAHGI